MAVKWIGNDGSHEGDLSQNDLLDVFEILNYVLDEMYEQRAKNVAKLATKINKAKGSRHKKRRPPF